MLAQPQHLQLVQWCTDLRQVHHWVLQSNMCPHFQQASAGRLPELSGEGAPPIYSVSSLSLLPSGRVSVRSAVDLEGSMPLASYPSSFGDLAGDEVWDLN